MKNVKLHDKEFNLFIKAADIDKAIENMATQINNDLNNEKPLFLSILNGSFMFTSDLLKQITIPGTEVSFVKLASYAGVNSTGKVKELIGLNQDITGKTVVILEDMIDSGQSMSYMIGLLKAKNPRQILLAAMLYKPKALTCEVKVDYCGIELENDFVVGRGLDYDGLGRNYPDLYILSEK